MRVETTAIDVDAHRRFDKFLADSCGPAVPLERHLCWGRPWQEITTKCEAVWFEAMGAINVARPTDVPHATEYVPQMVAMIEGLIATGHAYAKDGHVLFRVRSYADYGKLSGRSVDDMIAVLVPDVDPIAGEDR